MFIFLKISLYISMFTFFMSAPSAFSQTMTQSKLGSLISEFGTEVVGNGVAWQFVYNQVPMLCISDASADRMRLVAPIVGMDKLTEEHKDRMLQANYHSVLDTRYAISEGVVYAVFVHPLSTLQEADFLSAMKQTAYSALTFGSSYSSGEYNFGQ